MRAVVDWFLDREPFREQIRHMVEEAVWCGDVIPLPLAATD